ncbi:MAG: zinc finger domain-containing protein, partial [Candidatus Omnitrophota bacterium]
NGNASRLRFLLSGGEYLDFNDRRLFAEIGLSADWRNTAFVKSLGPEPFDITAARFHTMLSGRKIKIKPLLLDQTFVAGIGNLYAAEALFRAGVHPARQAGSLSLKESAELLAAITATLKEAIKHKGSSMDQYVRPSGERGDYVRFHKVYGKEGVACGGCGGKIKRISLGGRGTYFCPACQK